MERLFFRCSVVLLVLGIVACSKYSSSTSFRDGKYQSYLEECFAYAMAHTKGADDLYLMTAEKIGTITNDSEAESVVSAILSPEASIIDDITSGAYSIASIKDSKKNLEDLEATVREKAQAGMDVYELTWYYEGQEYTSIAIASDEAGVRYDNIGYLALSFTEYPALCNNDSWPWDLDTGAIDPGIAGADSSDTGVECEAHAKATFEKNGRCVDRYNHDHGWVILILSVWFRGSIITTITPSVFIEHTENDNWNLFGGFSSYDGGEGSIMVSFGWYYAFGYNCGPAVESRYGLFILPQDAFGETGHCLIGHPGDYS